MFGSDQKKCNTRAEKRDREIERESSFFFYFFFRQEERASEGGESPSSMWVLGRKSATPLLGLARLAGWPHGTSFAAATHSSSTTRSYGSVGDDDDDDYGVIHQVPWVRSVMTGNELVRNPRYNKVSERPPRERPSMPSPTASVLTL